MSDLSCQYIELHYLLKSAKTKLVTIVTDGELSFVIEENEDEDAIGLATFFNIESTVFILCFVFVLGSESKLRQSTVITIIHIALTRCYSEGLYQGLFT